jgi:hypothetical protein
MATEISIVRGTIELTTDKILVRKKWRGRGADKEPWTPIKKWLLELPLPSQLTEGTTRDGVPRALRSQQVWWSKNGKRFRFMKLPYELRATILQHALGENIYLNTNYNSLGLREITLGSRRHNTPAADENDDAGERPDPPNYAVLGLNKSLRKEALQAGWVGTRKYFIDFSYLRKTLNADIKPSKYNCLSRIQLNQSISQYLDLFGVDFDPVVQIQTANSSGAMLQAIPGLRHLELYFRSPYRRLPFPQQDWNINSYSCQKIMVDWVLTFAFPYIKHIPNVHLAGSVKTSSKRWWYYILKKEYRERKIDYRTHGYDHAQELAKIVEFPIDA